MSSFINFTYIYFDRRLTMKFLVICDYRENFKNYSCSDSSSSYNDHANKKNIQEIISGIRNLQYECEYFGGIPELVHAVEYNERFEDCIFLNFTDGMDQNYSRIQAPALLDILNVPYSGSGVFPSALMNNKHFCKQALSNSFIDMPKSCIVNAQIPLSIKELKNWKTPLFVKPNCEGSSLGISQSSVCHSIPDLEKETQKLLKDFEELIVEEYVTGVDVTNYLIGNGSDYPINEIVSAELFDKSPFAIYGSIEKQNKLRTLYYNDEFLPKDIIRKMQQHSIFIAQTIGVHDICRIDYRVNMLDKKIYFIEVNSAPRFSSTSEIGFIAKKQGITFDDMLKIYIDTVLKRVN